MKLKPSMLLVLFGLAQAARGGEGDSASAQISDLFPGQAISQAASNLFVVVFTNTREGSRAPRSDLPINFGLGSVTGLVYDIFLLRPEYGCKVSAVSAGGEPVEKTRVGRRYGRAFESVKGWDRSILDMSGRHADHERPYWTMAGPNAPGKRQLPAPEDLFRMEKPGRYRLTLELQVLAHLLHSRTTNIFLVKLPPVSFDTLKNPGQKGAGP